MHRDAVDEIRDVTLDLIEEHGLGPASFRSLLRGEGGQLDLLSDTPAQTSSVHPGRGDPQFPVDLAYLAIVDRWPDLYRLAVNVLGPGASIVPHAETHLDCRRWHLPIQTNPDATVTVANRTKHHPYGVPFALDVHQTHSARNDGDTPRVHLVWDVPRSDVG